MSVLIVPLLGPLHLRYPALNAVTLRDLLIGEAPDHVATTVLTEGELEQPGWQDTFELALPLAVVPWLHQTGGQLHTLGEPLTDRGAQEEFFRFAAEMPALGEQLSGYFSLQNRLSQELDTTLTLSALSQVILPLVREQQQSLLNAAGDGPATAWSWQRGTKAAQRIAGLAADGSRVAVLTALEEVPALEQALLSLDISLLELPERIPVSPAARERSLLDHAMLAPEQTDRHALLESLERLDAAEAGYARANLLLAGGSPAEALRLLEQVSHGDFSTPYFLPGFLLARLGQLRDLDGNRSGALQAYRAVRALDWAPAEALSAATAGLQTQFTLQRPAG